MIKSSCAIAVTIATDPTSAHSTVLPAEPEIWDRKTEAEIPPTETIQKEVKTNAISRYHID